MTNDFGKPICMYLGRQILNLTTVLDVDEVVSVIGFFPVLLMLMAEETSVRW